MMSKVKASAPPGWAASSLLPAWTVRPRALTGAKLTFQGPTGSYGSNDKGNFFQQFLEQQFLKQLRRRLYRYHPL